MTSRAALTGRRFIWSPRFHFGPLWAQRKWKMKKSERDFLPPRVLTCAWNKGAHRAHAQWGTTVTKCVIIFVREDKKQLKKLKQVTTAFFNCRMRQWTCATDDRDRRENYKISPNSLFNRIFNNTQRKIALLYLYWCVSMFHYVSVKKKSERNWACVTFPAGKTPVHKILVDNRATLFT